MKALARQGAWIGVLLTAPFVALSYLGWKAFGLPFVPFDLFDWLTRLLPGPIVTLAIDTAVRVTSGLHLANTAAAAKTGEQVMAIATVMIGGAVTGAVLFVLLSMSDEPALLFGGILGVVLGGIALVIEQALNRLPSGEVWNGAWVMLISIAWGLAFGNTRDRLRRGDPAGSGGSAQVDGDARRQFLFRLGGATAAMSFAGTLVGMVVGRDRSAAAVRWSASHALPNAGSPVVPVPGTRAEFTPLDQHYRIDTNTRAPVIDERRWRLQVGGLVEQPLTLTLDEIRADPPLHQFVTLECISNLVGGDLIGTTRWTGVSLQRVLARAKPGARATHLKITSADGFYETVALETIARDPRVMLTYAWDGAPLQVEHGFPLRIYVPNVYGMKQPKWITAIDVIDHFEAGYWVSRGWDREGRMKAESVIDTVTVSASGSREIFVGGIAHAGSRAISRVELRVDEGEWHEARIREPLSNTTWIVWRADLPYVPGDHTFTVRCSEGDGTPQTGRLHTRRIKL